MREGRDCFSTFCIVNVTMAHATSRWQAWLDSSQDGPDMLIYRGPDGQRLNRAQFASWLQSTKVELGYASDAD